MSKTHQIIYFCLCLLLIAGCSSSPTREKNPDKFDLIKSGQIKRVHITRFKDCLVKGSEVKNRIAYNAKTSSKITAKGYRVETYGGEVFLLLSVDIFTSGKTQMLRAKNSELTDLTQQISAFDYCLDRYK